MIVLKLNQTGHEDIKCLLFISILLTIKIQVFKKKHNKIPSFLISKVQ